ncbi:MAG: DUF6617 family protein [Fulvivirga sp.]
MNQLEVFNRILFLNLRPWLLVEVSDLKFKQDLAELKKVYHQYQPSFEISFPKPLNNRRKYFYTLINSETIQFLNYIHTQVSESINANAKKYHIHMALTRTLKEKLNETAQIINDRNYSPETFDPKFGILQESAQLADEAYVLYLLKHQLIRLYLEIQDAYTEHLKEDALTEDDIYLTFFNHTAPNPSHIIEADKITIAKPVEKSESVHKQTSFKPITTDFRDEAKGVLSYSTIVKNQDRFARFEESLRLHDYIDDNYNFLDKHGMKQELAMIYHLLISKGYFNPIRFNPNKAIKEVDIRKFLDHRYNTDLDKQFRTYRKNQEEIATFVDQHYWLTKLPLG